MMMELTSKKGKKGKKGKTAKKGKKDGKAKKAKKAGKVKKIENVKKDVQVKEEKVKTGKTIYIGNLNYEWDEETIETLFTRFGTVEWVKLVHDNEYNRSQGIAFVQMPKAKEAYAAIKGLNGRIEGGRTLKVSEAKEKKGLNPKKASGEPEDKDKKDKKEGKIKKAKKGTPGKSGTKGKARKGLDGLFDYLKSK